MDYFGSKSSQIAKHWAKTPFR